MAGALAARRLVLIKPARGDDTKHLVDPLFLRTLPATVEHVIITADDLGQLDVALDEGGGSSRGRRVRQGP